jgi:hypothetical protein
MEAEGFGTFIGIGGIGASSLIAEVEANEGSFSPEPDTSGLSSVYYFWGTKQ